ncbi:hypothetical protein K438DRAFT_1832812 [Mycena galopus ATCC 62051]|nr:hypothetical protein K438DRAFT_1832812 [Mycena galopus ATCC 62051]
MRSRYKGSPILTQPALRSPARRGTSPSHACLRSKRPSLASPPMGRASARSPWKFGHPFVGSSSTQWRDTQRILIWFRDSLPL